MKAYLLHIRIALILIVIFSTIPSLAQSTSDQTSKTDVPVYELYPTQNVWTFLKLNTRTGEVWVLQFDTKDSNRFQYLLSGPRIRKDRQENGRFTLHPTDNVWNFILLDQKDGHAWQVQWDLDMENQFIVPIPEIY